MIDIDFSLLFQVQLLHRYYADGRCPDFTIVPSAKASAILAGCKFVVRQHGNQLIAATQSPAGSPLTPPFNRPGPNNPLTFFLQCNTVTFFNITDLPGAAGGKLMYFTNRNNNAANGSLFLSAPMSAYDSATTYSAGDLVLSGGTVYEAIHSSNSGSPFPVTDTAHWVATDQDRYVTAPDLLTWLPAISQYVLPGPQASVTYQVNGYNPALGDYSTVTLGPTAVNFPNPVSSFSLDLSALAPGKYILVVDGAQTAVYLNSELTGTSTYCAVIELFDESTLPAGYALFDATGTTLLSPNYTIDFMNRATIWQYTLVTQQAAAITDTAGVYQFTCTVSPPPVVVTITSNTPIPLVESSYQFSISQPGSVSISNIACAGTARLQQISQAGDTYYCSPIYLNY